MKSKHGFTLVELVIVILILGILAAVAAPKFLNTSAAARDNGLKQTLSIVRDAIEIYAAENGGNLPGQADDLPGDLAPYLRGEFPTCPVGPQDKLVTYTTGSGITADAVPMASWKYSVSSGEFICNSTAVTASDPIDTYDAL